MLLRGETKIDFFVIQKITRVKQPGLLNHFAPDQAIAARHPIAGSNSGMVPGHVIDQLYGTEETAQTCSVEENIQRSGEITGRRLQRSVTADESHPKQPALRMGVHICNRFGDGIRRDKCIGVQQKNISAARPLKRLVVGSSDTDVDGIFDETELSRDALSTMMIS